MRWTCRQRDWLGPLRPDRLAEQLIASELARRPELIAPLFTGLGEARAARALTVLARAALTQDRAVGLLGTALAADLDHLAVPALSVAVETNPVMGELLSQVIGSQPVSQETLTRVAEASPHPSFALAAPAAVVLQRLTDDSADDSERAGWLVSLSIRLGDLGRREEALAAIEEAVAIRRQLARGPPRRVPARPRQSLNNQSDRLVDLGRREEALAAIEEAVAIYRQLARGPPRRVPPRPRQVAEQPVQPPVGAGAAGGGPGRDRGSRRHLPPAGRGPPRRVPARPRHVAEQPVRSPGRPGAAGGGPGRDRGSRQPSTASWPRPAPTRSCPTSPCR